MGVWDEAKREQKKQENQEEATELMEKKIRQAAMEARREQEVVKRAAGKKGTSREMDDDYGNFSTESEPYTAATVSPVKVTVIVVVVLAILAVAGYFAYGYVQRVEWIKKQVDTVEMVKARKSAYLNRLPAKNLQGTDPVQGEVELYSIIYFPEQNTVLATLDVPPDFEKLYCFLVDGTGKAYPGWYNSTVVRFDIAKIMFEHVPTGELMYMDCIDSKTVPNDDYNPSVENPSRIRFPLTPAQDLMPEESASAQGSSSTAEETQN